MMKIFNKDQITALKRQTRRGMTWDNSTVKKALKLRFSCGTSGYTSVLESGIPLPSVRTLQRRLQGIDYEPGILTTVFRYLKAKVCSFYIEVYHLFLTFCLHAPFILSLILWELPIMMPVTH